MQALVHFTHYDTTMHGPQGVDGPQGLDDTAVFSIVTVHVSEERIRIKFNNLTSNVTAVK